jgi:hypothetical protein
MKNLPIVILTFLLATTFSVQSQKMTNNDLENIIYVVADSLRGNTGNWQFMIKDRVILCITDEKNNRMRMMSPIIEQKKLAYTDMLKLMEANFHTALDVKYAISDDILWSVFIHPLKELSKDEVLSAINQVYAAAMTYGTTYNSTGLSFPDKRKEEVQSKKKI